MFRGWQKVSYIEYPGNIATVLFTAGCNFRCPYCHNPELLESPQIFPEVKEEEVLRYLEERKGLIDAVCITGGEPLLWKEELLLFLTKVKEQGFKVKVDTNGSSYSSFLAFKEIVDLWGIDYKVPLPLYHLVQGEKEAQSVREVVQEALKFPEKVELRTTIFPPFHRKEILLEMAENIKSAYTWYWQNFNPFKTLDPQAQKLAPYPLSLLQKWQEEINQEIGKDLIVIRPS